MYFSGTSNSYANDVAERIGLDKDLISRARELLDCLKNNRSIQPLPKFQVKLKSTSHLSKLNIAKPDLEETNWGFWIKKNTFLC